MTEAKTLGKRLRSDVIPSEGVLNDTLRTSSDLLSYLEKFRVKEDLRRMLLTNLLQAKSLVMVDHHNLIRDIDVVKKSGHSIADSTKQKYNTEFDKLNEILISYKSCECEYPNLERIKDITTAYRRHLQTQRVDPWVMSEHEINLLNEKIATCEILLHSCDVLDHNIIWKEHLVGGFALEDDIPDPVDITLKPNQVNLDMPMSQSK